MMIMSEWTDKRYQMSSHVNWESVITVHGLRDDHNTVWRNQEGKQWIPNQLFSSMCIRQLDYMYAADNDARIFQEDGIKAEAKELLRLYVEERRKLPEVGLSNNWDSKKQRSYNVRRK